MHIMTSADVNTLDDLIEYARSRYGVVVHWKETARFRGMWKEFHRDNPHVTIQALAKVIDWAKENHRKLKTLCGIFVLASYAFEHEAIPVLDPEVVEFNDLEDAILRALQLETDDSWRLRLLASSGPARAEAFSEWRKQRSMAVA